MSYQTFVLVSDTHGSFICPSWRKAVLKFCKDVKPDRRIHCGDVWDFTCLMKKASEEQRMVAIADDLEAGMEFLNDFFGQDGAKNKNDVLTWEIMMTDYLGRLRMPGAWLESMQLLSKRRLIKQQKI